MADFSTDLSPASRGDLAYILFNALGVPATGSGAFNDGGYLDAITTTLSDLGITKGVGGGKFGTAQPTTRGEAFTMVARALGLASIDDSIEQASKALVNAGIVKGLGNDPTNLGLGQPLRRKDMQTLIGRIGPELNRVGDTGTSRSEQLSQDARDAADRRMAEQDPRYAAYLANLGVRRGEIADELALREEHFLEDTRRRSEAYARKTEEAIKGVGMDFENRGLYRSGTRLQRGADTREKINQALEQIQHQASRDYQSGNRQLQMEQNRIDRELAEERVGAAAGREEERIGDTY